MGEGDFAKIERLVELYEKNLSRSKEVEKNILQLQEERDKIYENYNPEDDINEFDLLRLEAGLYSLQMTCVVITFVFALSEVSTKEKLKNQISLLGEDLIQVYRVVSDYIEQIDETNEKNTDRLRKAAAELYLAIQPQVAE